jgi:hypothetical protein
LLLVPERVEPDDLFTFFALLLLVPDTVDLPDALGLLDELPLLLLKKPICIPFMVMTLTIQVPYP